MGAEKSFIVVGKGLETALNKASIVLHCPQERIAYEILQQAKPGKYGQPGIPCKLRVTPVAPPAEEMDTQNGVDSEEALLRVPLPLTGEELIALSPDVFLRCMEDAVQSDHFAAAPAAAEEWTAGALREIVGDAGLQTGAISHQGDLHIHGSVLKGMAVRASGCIHVFGDVETAFVDAGGDVVISGGLLGTARSARGSITCRFAQGAQMDAIQGNVRVQESAMHTRIYAKGEVQIGGILLGGSCYGEKQVQAHTAGSPTGVPTTITTGGNAHLYAELESLRRRALRHAERLGECERVCLELLPAEQSGRKLPVHERTRLWQASVRRVRLSVALRGLRGQKSRLLGMINGERGSRIGISGCAYARVKILIDDLGMEVRSVTQFATFSKDYDSGELRVTPLH